MMTRKQIEAEYAVTDGIIMSPGKFEGEPVWAPYFYEALLDGRWDTQEDDVCRIAVTPADLAQFPELAGEPWVEVYENDSGFVFVK